MLEKYYIYIYLVFFTYSSTKSKSVMGFALPTNLFTTSESFCIGFTIYTKRVLASGVWEPGVY